jgi:hypothetical protein
MRSHVRHRRRHHHHHHEHMHLVWPHRLPTIIVILTVYLVQT